jgi:hypothetical protein
MTTDRKRVGTPATQQFGHHPNNNPECFNKSHPINNLQTSFVCAAQGIRLRRVPFRSTRNLFGVRAVPAVAPPGAKEGGPLRFRGVGARQEVGCEDGKNNRDCGCQQPGGFGDRGDPG